MVLIKEFLPLFKIKHKFRHDSIFDRYHRVFMVKLLIVMTIVTGVSWYKDKINCQTPKHFEVSEDMEKYISSTCWIRGVYIYQELQQEYQSMAYYGIPKDISVTGINLKSKRTCKVGQPQCKEMDKTFFLQYQWLPFFLFGCACLYYLPYILYRWINWDIIRLFEALQKKPIKYQAIKRKFFKPALFDRRSHNLHIGNILVKLSYIAVNIIIFFACNQLLNGTFYAYGTKWMDWNELNDTIQFDYMGKRDFPKPGNELLPPFGFCELYLQSKDVKRTYNDKHKLICEMSQNILYQYAFIVFWFAISVGLCVSIIGLLWSVFQFFRRCFLKSYHLGNRKNENEVFKSLSPRQREYLEIIYYDYKIVYGELIKFLEDSLK